MELVKKIVVGGGGGGWVVVCKPILVFSLGFGQAEQKIRFRVEKNSEDPPCP